jgi:hypothetical protein
LLLLLFVFDDGLLTAEAVVVPAAPAPGAPIVLAEAAAAMVFAFGGDVYTPVDDKENDGGEKKGNQHVYFIKKIERLR